MSGDFLGPFFLGSPTSVELDLLRRWQPAAVKMLDPNRDAAAQVRAACPNAILVARVYLPDSEVADRIMASPPTAARYFHEKSLANPAVDAGLFDLVQVPNEVCQFWDQIGYLQDCEVERAHLANAAGKFRILAYNFSVGQPDLPRNDPLAYWRRIATSLRWLASEGHVLGLHEYGAPDLWGPAWMGGAAWLAERFQTQVMPHLGELGLEHLKVIVGEHGIDGLLPWDEGPVGEAVQPVGTGQEPQFTTPAKDLGPVTHSTLARQPTGWQRFTTAEDYARQLRDMATFAVDHGVNDTILGRVIFCSNSNSPSWTSYDIKGDVFQRLAETSTAGDTGGTIPPDPGGGHTMPTYPNRDWDPNLSQTWVDGEKVMGVMAGIHTVEDQLEAGELPSLTVGQPYYRLISATFINEIDAHGQHNISVDVLDENGQRRNGTTVEHGWPWERWPQRDGSVTGTVYGANLANWGLYAQYDAWQVPGPYWVRVKDSNVPSDVFYGAGLPWNRHVSFVAVFQRVAWQVIPEPGPGPGPTPEPGDCSAEHEIIIARLDDLADQLDLIAAKLAAVGQALS